MVNKTAKIIQVIFVLLPLVYLWVLRLLFGGVFDLSALLIGGIFTLGALLFSPWLKSEQISAKYARINLLWPFLLILCIISTLITAFTDHQVAAWIGFAAFFILSLGIHKSSCGKLFSIRWWIVTGLLGGVVALVTVAFNQVLTRFSEEEFFAALQGAAFFIYWFLTALANTRNPGVLKFPDMGWVKIDLRIIRGTGGLLLILFGLLVAKNYQASFYAQDSDIFPGISNEKPFLCGITSPEVQTASGNIFFQDYLQKISENPDLKAPDKGLLYLASGAAEWAKAFHDSLLIEARQNLFTKPADSIKFDQYLASLRVYTYARVGSQLPDLFSKEEQAVITSWFHAINRRAMTVEWVDWLYGLAFSAKPEGPYENQENGAGLIALLESENLADPNLSQQNRDYLARHPRGWELRFRNTDDSIEYQTEWTTNALFQQLYTRKTSNQNIRNSFEWMLYQMLPDGRAPQYNLPSPYALTGSLYLGANLLKDPRFLWLADKSLHTPWNLQFSLAFQIGTEKAMELTGASPAEGSCLLYGDSGLPTQVGPLAPDKIVLRDGWSDNDNYLLLNLRFMGWHRYKGTNTIILIDKGAPLINEQIYGVSLPWLPKGRSLFRDKRIPRENLNGLQIQRQGFDAVLYALLGYGGPWAQDPPFSAHVDSFSTGAEMDISQTSMTNWHNWAHSRKIYFVHNGIVVVLDEAKGPVAQSASVTWNMVNPQKIAEGRYLLNSQKAELALLNLESGRIVVSQGTPQNGTNSEQVLYNGPKDGHLRLVSVILTGDWLGAQTKLIETGGAEVLEIQQADKTFELKLNLLNP